MKPQLSLLSNVLKGDDDDGIYSIVHNKFYVKTKGVTFHEHVDGQGRNDGTGVSQTMCRLVNQQSTLEIEIYIFSGNSLDCRYIMTVFEETIERKIGDPCGKLT